MAKRIKKSDRLYFLWMLLHQTSVAIYKSRKKELSKYGINIMENGIIMAVYFLGDKATPAEVSRLVFREPQTVSSLINMMKDKGILLKEQQPGFKGRIVIRLTDKGHRILENKIIKRDSILRVMSLLSKEEQKQLWFILLKLRNEALRRSVKRRVILPTNQEIF